MQHFRGKLLGYVGADLIKLINKEKLVKKKSLQKQ